MRFGIGEQITAIGVRGKQLGCSFASSILRRSQHWKVAVTVRMILH